MIENDKIAEYLSNYYKFLEYASKNQDDNFHDILKELYSKGVFPDDFDIKYFKNMVVTYCYFCLIKIFSFQKDYLFKGVDEKTLDSIYINDSIPSNKEVIDNFSKKDIVLYVRNALAHSNSDNQLYWFEKNDDDEIVIHINLKKVKASIGSNKGNITPFDVVLDLQSLSSFTYALGNTRSSHVLGVSVKNSTSSKIAENMKNSTSRLRRILDDTYYYRDFYELLSEKDKTDVKKLTDGDFYNKYTSLIEYKKTKTKTKKLSVVQKDTLYSNFKKWLGYDLNLDSFQLYDYESSKVIPVSLAKIDSLYLSFFRGINFLKKGTYRDSTVEIINGLLGNEDNIFSNFRFLFMSRENYSERIKYGLVDYYNDNNMALSMFMGQMLENVISDEEVVIDNKSYPRNKLRNSFTHGRWYVSEKKWELFDWKKDEFDCNWHKAIYIDSIKASMLDYLDSSLEKKKNGR